MTDISKLEDAPWIYNLTSLSFFILMHKIVFFYLSVAFFYTSACNLDDTSWCYIEYKMYSRQTWGNLISFLSVPFLAFFIVLWILEPHGLEKIALSQIDFTLGIMVSEKQNAVLSQIFKFTFMHSADAFIRSDIAFKFMPSLGIKPMTLFELH